MLRRLLLPLIIVGVVALTSGADAGCGAALPLDPWGPDVTVLYVEDHTSEIWPTKVATADWAKVSAVPVKYGKCSHDPTTVCTVVTESSDPGAEGEAVGITTRTVDHRVEIILYTARTQAFNANAHDYRVIVCHELGHALGARHNESGDSCMHSEADPLAAIHPGKLDIAFINGART